MNDIHIGDVLYFKKNLLWKDKWDGSVVTMKHINNALGVESVKSEHGIVDLKEVSMIFRPGLYNPIYIAEEV